MSNKISCTKFVGNQTYFTPPLSVEQDDPLLVRAISRLRHTNEMLDRLVGEAESLNDRILGVQPATSGVGSDIKAPSNGLLEELHETVGRTSQLADYLTAQIERAKAIG